MDKNELTNKLTALLSKQDHRDQFNAENLHTLAEAALILLEEGGGAGIADVPMEVETIEPNETPEAVMRGETLVFRIPQGEEGPTGPQGADGKSAYQVWLDDNGWTAEQHPVSEYINSLKAHVAGFKSVSYDENAPTTIGDTASAIGSLSPSADTMDKIVLMPNSDGTATIMYATTATESEGTTTYAFSCIGELAIDTSNFLDSSNVDETGLKNPTSSQVAKAEDVMPLAAKLEGVTAVEDKLTVIGETTGYINFNNTTGSASSYKWGKFDVQGYKRVRFKGYIRGGSYSTPGFCFVDEDDNWMDGYAYDYDSNAQTSLQKEYMVDVPKGAVYLKTNTVAGTNMQASDFYCYGLKGDTAIELVDGGWDEIEVGGEIKNTLQVNNTKYLTITPSSGSESVFYEEGNQAIKTKLVFLADDWKKLRVTTAGRVTTVVFLKEVYNSNVGATFQDLVAGGYVCDGITDYLGMFNFANALNGAEQRVTHIPIPSDAKVAYFQIRQFNDLSDRTPYSIVPIIGKRNNTKLSSDNCKVNLRLGKMSDFGGFTNALDDDRVALKYMVSNPYELNGCRITSVDGLEAGETLAIHMYDGNFAYMGAAADVNNMVKCEYVLLELCSDTVYSHGIRTLTINYSTDGNKKIEKTYWGRYRTDPYWVTFEVERLNNAASTSFDVDTLVCDNDSASGAYAGSTQRVYTTGYVILPPNYDRNGEPVPLAIFLHGTGGYTYGESSIEYYADLLKFVAKNGYAVVDCCTISNIYSATTDLDGNTRTGYKDVNYPCRLTVDCYVSLYKYVTEMFNIDKDKVFAWGKSSGGRMAVVLGQHKFIPIKAIGILNGSTESLTTLRCMGQASRVVIKKLMEDDLGIVFPSAVATEFIKSPDMVFKPANSVSSDMIDFLLENKDKMAGYNPMFIGISDFDIDAYEEAQFACSLEADAIATSLLDTNTTEGQTIRNLVANGHRISNVPTKLWAAEDDENVPYQLSVIYTALTKKGGGICELRTIPANNGKHWAVDIAQPNLGVLHPGVGFPNDLPTAPKTSYVTKFGEEVEGVTVTYAELVDWFNQW